MTQQTNAVLGRSYTGFQTTALVLLRILIGWHFFYEGLAKLGNPPVRNRRTLGPNGMRHPAGARSAFLRSR